MLILLIVRKPRMVTDRSLDVRLDIIENAPCTGSKMHGCIFEQEVHGCTFLRPVG